MRRNTKLEAIFAGAEASRRCLWAENDAQRRMLRRRADCGELVQLHGHYYARAVYWETLGMGERYRHVIRSHAVLHPNWVFCDMTAAAMHGLAAGPADTMALAENAASPDSPDSTAPSHAKSCAEAWHGAGSRSRAESRCSAEPSVVLPQHMYQLHVATTRNGRARDCESVKYHYACALRYETVDGVKVTGLRQTLFDCARHYELNDALPVIKSALHGGFVAQADLVNDFDTLPGRHRAHALSVLLHAI
ncbi:hypothetical protein [Bifidobacterium tibiigranuli]|uniref:hypothetical protein n=1 Tax=Bifidobacterium tibiigranuli TaxID=2172043 RepID=UPI0023553B57|nr:hypothetical protein [Bifidobacterium tibiigranuli]MCI1210326.1 hypothetical protein [Bifidobacterium tibiigranuli]MCI1220666.1 hypothetical protein [Bifidobacterium tibiigranuli]MCI1233128.1 hypothetical protein [Bifidobacterium tibiigranuli]